jgi:hypothetical protein
VAALVAALALRPGATPAQTIDTILVENANIFDERDRSLVARWANALHVTTSPWVIRRTILIRPGEPYDSARVVESARALRSLGVFRSVELDTMRVDGRLAARIRTADGWSTRPTFSFSSTGGDATVAAGLLETNLLGTAITAGAWYRATPDRDGVELEFFNRHFIARNARLYLGYRRYNDGRRAEWIAGRPFSESVARWALETYGRDGRERMLVFRDAILDSAARREATLVGVRGGVAVAATPKEYLRLWGAALWRREDYVPDTATGPSPYSASAAAGVGLEWTHVRLRTAEHFNSYARSEDVDLSQTLRLGVWIAPRAWGYPAGRAGAGPELDGQVSTVWRRGFALLRVTGGGIHTGAGLDSGRVEGALTLVDQNLPRQTLILHAEGGAAERPAPGSEFDLWLSRRGPRLFGAHAFSGTRRLWVALENRVLVDHDWLGLVGIGLAAFAEWGGAWYADQTARTGGNAGLGLRFGPIRSARGRAFEIAGGWRFGEGRDGGRWALTVRSAFAFAATDY